MPQRGRERFTHQLVVFEDRDPHRTLRLTLFLPVHDGFIHCRTVFCQADDGGPLRDLAVVLLQRRWTSWCRMSSPGRGLRRATATTLTGTWSWRLAETCAWIKWVCPQRCVQRSQV